MRNFKFLVTKPLKLISYLIIEKNLNNSLEKVDNKGLNALLFLI